MTTIGSIGWFRRTVRISPEMQRRAKISDALSGRAIMASLALVGLLLYVVGSGAATSAFGQANAGPLRLVFCCRADNDLYRVMASGGEPYPRCDTAADAIHAATEGAGVLILADGYPNEATPLDAAIFAQTAAKKLRLYVEYPSMLPNLEVGKTPTYLKTGPYQAIVERTVVASDAFGSELKKMRIMMIHDCHYLPVETQNPHLVLARVEGYDTAVYGLPKETHPILFEHPRGDILVATTKLSQFVTGRYAPTEAWGPVWRMIFGWLQPGQTSPTLTWTPTVRPSYGKAEPLPADAEENAIQRGVAYYGKSRLFIHPSWPKDTGIDPIPAAWPVGDGTHGIGECYISKRIFADGTQAVSRTVRSDCNLEAAMGLACGAAALGESKYAETAHKLNDLIFFHSILSQGPRGDPKSPSFGLLGWGENSAGIYYGDDNARAALSAITAAAMLNSDRWDEPILRTILANFRTTGPKGFRPQNILEADLQKNGWRYYRDLDHVDYCPHMQAWIWCTYLWLYNKTKYEPLLERARTGLTMMKAYPNWRLEANRVEQERCRMLLPLAWLVRVDDTPEHRRWLDTIARYVIGLQDASGAIPQIPGTIVASNEGYGEGECALAHQAGDPATDALYSINFAFLGMHEAAAATGDERYAQSAAKMADFFIRSQTQSETHPELDGTWYRGFDFKKWDYWASDGDAGWGVWTNEIGWTHSWITTTLTLRRMKTSLWTLIEGSQIAKRFDPVRLQMLPDEEPNSASNCGAGVPPAAEECRRDARTTMEDDPARSDVAPKSPPDDPATDILPQSAQNERYRPQFHFTYRKGWLSDMNGLVFYKGEYHLFSQHCPAGPALEYPNIHWGHAVSTDLVHWRELPPALAPDEKNGPIFSGSAVVDWKNSAGFQTGAENALAAVYTGGRYVTDNSKDGVICLAYSNDRGRTWTKYAENPVLEAITHYNRDPKVFWHEPTKRWIMAITLSCGGWLDGDYWFALFSSPDLKTWKETSRFEMPKGIDCPDMFELPVDGDPNNTRWVFWAGDGTYAVGAFDGEKFTREGDIHPPLFTWEENGANGYAAQTFNDIPASDGRKIQMAWLRHGSYPDMPFNQQASFPCELSLHSGPERIVLCRRPVKEIALLHGKRRRWIDVTLAPGQNLLADVRGELFDIRAKIETGGAGRIAFQAYGVPVVYDAGTKTLSCSGKSVPLEPVNGRIKLQLLIDRTSLEIFGNDGVLSMSFCFVPPTNDAQLGVCAEGAPARIVSLDVFDMQSMWLPPPSERKADQ